MVREGSNESMTAHASYASTSFVPIDDLTNYQTLFFQCYPNPNVFLRTVGRHPPKDHATNLTPWPSEL